MENLRKSLIKKRNSVSLHKRRSAAEQAVHYLVGSALVAEHKNVGSYFSVKGEFPTDSLNLCLMQQKKNIYFPVLGDNSFLKFRRYREESELCLNRLRIPEPSGNEPLIKVEHLNTIIIPIVGFDNAGNRIGMGGGHYDRSLASLKNLQVENKPFLLGIAFDCQEVESTNPQLWDIPMDAILTESGIKYFTNTG